MTTTVTFAQDAQDLVAAAAGEVGVSVCQFVREAAIMRAANVISYPTEAAERRRALAHTPQGSDLPPGLSLTRSGV